LAISLLVSSVLKTFGSRAKTASTAACISFAFLLSTCATFCLHGLDRVVWSTQCIRTP
jgi:hypothetical protein